MAVLRGIKIVSVETALAERVMHRVPTLTHGLKTVQQELKAAKHSLDTLAKKAVKVIAGQAAPEAELAGIRMKAGERTLARGQEKAVAWGSAQVVQQFSAEVIDEAVKWVMRDPNKLRHIFANTEHKLEVLVAQFQGSREATVRAALEAAQGKLPTVGKFNATPVIVKGTTVYIKGIVIDGVPKLGTMFIK